MGTTGLPKGPGKVTAHCLGMGGMADDNLLGRAAAGLYPSPQSLIMHRDNVEHARRRRPWMRAFSTNALKEYHPQIKKRVGQFVDSLSAENEAINLAQRISWFTYDFMSDMA